MENTLLIFTGVLTVAVLMQAFLFFGIYRSIRQVTAKIDNLGKDLLKNFNDISAKVDEALTNIKIMSDSFKSITDSMANTTEIVHKKVVKMDAFVDETIRTAQLEILRIQDTIQMVTDRTRETIELLHSGIQSPINEINAISRALRVGFDFLFRRRKNISGASGHDEEMFI
jgi:methyl-accepting chemotaxis protein